MKKESLEMNRPAGYTPNIETEKLRRAVVNFNRKIRPYAEQSGRDGARILIHAYESRRGEQLKRSRFNF